MKQTNKRGYQSMRTSKHTTSLQTSNSRLLISCLCLTIVLMGFQTTPKKQPAAKPKPAAAVVSSDLKSVLVRGKAVYMQQCLACHQVDGGGVPHLNAPLDGASLVVGNNKERLVRIVLKGMTERVELDGEYYSNNMAPHPDLTDQQISDVLTFIRNSWTNKASAVTVAEVKAVRAKTK